MYNDNGLLSNAFEKNEYEILGFEAAVTKRYLEIGFEAEFGGDWNPSEKEIILIIHNINWNPKEIKVNGKRKQISSEKKKLTIPFKWDIHKELKIKITLK
jgi:hypothetical protein